MDLIQALKDLWHRRWLVIASGLLAMMAAVLVLYSVSLLPPGVSKRVDVRAQGSASILVDSSRSPIADTRKALGPLIERAAIFARLMSGRDVIDAIGKETGTPPGQIDTGGPTPLPGEAPGAEQAPAKTHPYGIMIAQSGELPVISVLTRAPTVPEAKALAAAAPVALRKAVGRIQAEQETPQRLRVEFRSLGPAQGGMIDDAIGKKIALAAFIFVFGVCILLILAIPRLVDAWRAEPGGRPVDGRFA